MTDSSVPKIIAVSAASDVRVTVLGIPGPRGLTGPDGAAAWGGITGTLADQTDLQDELDLKANAADLGTAAAADTGDFDAAGTAAAAVSAHVALSNPHTQYALDADLGTAAAADTGDFATAAQGALADAAVQPADLADVATSGDAADVAVDDSGFSNLAGTDVQTVLADIDSQIGGGGTYSIQGSDVTNSTTSAADTGMAFIAQPNTRYLVEGFFIMQADASTTGVQVSIQWPSGSSGAARIMSPNNSTSTAERYVEAGSTTQVSATGVPAANTDTLGTMTVNFLAGGSPSIFRVRFRSEVGGSTVTIKAGSFIRIVVIS